MVHDLFWEVLVASVCGPRIAPKRCHRMFRRHFTVFSPHFSTLWRSLSDSCPDTDHPVPLGFVAVPTRHSWAACSVMYQYDLELEALFEDHGVCS